MILMSEWNEDLYVSVETINRIALWITEQQNNVTGAFEETSDHIYNRNFGVIMKKYNSQQVERFEFNKLKQYFNDCVICEYYMLFPVCLLMILYFSLFQPNTVTEDGKVNRWHIAMTAKVGIALAQATRLTGVSRPYLCHGHTGQFSKKAWLAPTDFGEIWKKERGLEQGSKQGAARFAPGLRQVVRGWENRWLTRRLPFCLCK